MKRESVSTLLIYSKIHVLAGNLLGLASDSIKNDLALGLKRHDGRGDDRAANGHRRQPRERIHEACVIALAPGFTEPIG